MFANCELHTKWTQKTVGFYLFQIMPSVEEKVYQPDAVLEELEAGSGSVTSCVHNKLLESLQTQKVSDWSCMHSYVCTQEHHARPPVQA